MIDNIYSHIGRKYPEIRHYLSKTPLYSSTISHNLLVKAENTQYTGSFKLRGAASKLIELSKKSHTKVITASTGNHGLAVATLADKLGMSVVIFVPDSISSSKEKKLMRYPVDLVKIPGDSDKSEHAARKRSEDEGIPFVSPYNDLQIIAGQGSIGLELAQQTDLVGVDRIYITIGGGGLISGVGSYLSSIAPHIEIVGCQPVNSAAMYYSIQAGEVIEIDHQFTISDGSAGGLESDSITFPVVQKVVDRYVLVGEDEIKAAMYQAFIHHNAVIEGSAGVALASFLKDETQVSQEEKSIVILCGGNIDPNLWLSIINQQGAN